MKYIKILLVTLLFPLGSCNKYLDIVPDNLPTIEYSFALRSMAEKYLFTCYSYMPHIGDPATNPAFFAGGELWHNDIDNYSAIRIARGEQNTNSPLINHWDGSRSLFAGIRDCNIFLDNIHKVKEMSEAEKAKWRAEVMFLKAYYHFYLLRLYGPIPLIRKNADVDADKEEMYVFREPIDECVNYIVELLDEAALNLPPFIENEGQDLGRITLPIALSVKALVLVTAASPLYNGNPDYTGLKDTRGKQLFNPVYDPLKWDRAAKACNDAITACHSAGIKLYDFKQEIIAPSLRPETVIQMSIRNSVAKRWNTETIWRTTISAGNVRTRILELGSQARLDNSAVHVTGSIQSDISPTLAMAEMFYTKNGVPINEDKSWDYAGRFNLKTATTAEKYDLRLNYQTVALNYDREPRYYASLGFDGGNWFGQSKLDENNQFWVEGKAGQYSGKPTSASFKYSITGFWPKKLVNYENAYLTVNYTGSFYPWPVMRLADLYLLYAEALTEVSGPGNEVFNYINQVRARAGLKTVQESWNQHSTDPGKYTTKEGLREIIRYERGLELAFEGHRFWDVRRWKTATKVLNNYVIRGWDIDQTDAVNYYREKTLYVQSFQLRDYFWPIAQNNLIVNKNLVQNPGW